MSPPAPEAPASAEVLAIVAAWDLPLLRGAVVTLRAVSDRFGAWRFRLEALGRSLGDERSWSGAGADRAVAAVAGLTEVAAAVDAATDRSVEAFHRLVAEAEPAQEYAGQALAAGLLVADEAAVAHRAAALTEAALVRISAAESAAAAAGERLAHVGVLDAFPRPTFGDLADAVSVQARALPPEPPLRSPPTEVAAWWAALSPAVREFAVRTWPAAMGSLDGLPAWARDRANRLSLDRARAGGRLSAGAAANAVAVEGQLEALRRAGQEVQLHDLDVEGNRVVLVLGDLDTAEAVGVLVPGVGNTPADDLLGLVADASSTARATAAAAPGLAVATVVWLGYRTPAGASMLARHRARDGGRRLDAALDGWAASRAAAGLPRPRTTLLGHSYGSVVVDEAAEAPGRLAADAVVLLGSPGTGDGAGSLEAAEVYDAASRFDPIAWAGWFGPPTWSPAFDSVHLPVQAGTGHSGYYDEGPTVAALGQVVAGGRCSTGTEPLAPR